MVQLQLKSRIYATMFRPDEDVTPINHKNQRKWGWGMLKRKIVILSSLAVLVIGGCAGREARPISSYRPGDDSLNCAAIDSELYQIKATVVPLYDEAGDKTGWNVGWGLVGALVFWPALFALDLSDAEKEEIRAYQSRWDNLVRLRSEKRCPGQAPQMLDADGRVVRASPPAAGAAGTGGPSMPTADEFMLKSVQKALGDRGYYKGPIDGRMGRDLRNALLMFQSHEGLRTTGEVDQATLSRLGLPS